MNYQDARVSFHEYYSANEAFLRSGSDFYRSLIESIISDSNIRINHINSRVKTRESCLEKFDKKYRATLEQKQEHYLIRDHISDLIGVRVVCFYEQDVRQIADILEKTLTSVEQRKDRFTERDSLPNEFGYRAIHLNLKLNSDRSSLAEYRRFSSISFEVQIRTVIQDAWSVLDHKLQYKGNASPKLKRAINALAAVFEMADEKFLLIKNQIEEEQEEAKRLLMQTAASLNQSESNSNLNIETTTTAAVSAPPIADVISVNELVKARFPGFLGSLNGASRLLDDVDALTISLTLEEVTNAISEKLSTIENYERTTMAVNRLNPLTKLRHCLYLTNKTRFKDALFDYQRENFDNWLREHANDSHSPADA